MRIGRRRWTISATTVCITLFGGLILAGVAGCPFLNIGFPASDAFFPPIATREVLREIEEADIVKVQDGLFYVANPFTGLRIIDGRDADHPRLMGRVPLGGRAVELFVRDGVALVFTAADFLNCAGESIGFETGVFDPQVLPDYAGSRLWVVDVTDPQSPAVAGVVDFDGFVTATRRVGDVVYAAGNAFFQPVTDPEEESESIFDRGAFVTSINVADAANALVVETERFPGRSLDVHVSDEAMYVFGHDSLVFDTTVVSYVDVSDPAGDIEVRDQLRVPGSVGDRYFVDAHRGAFRIITEEYIPSVYATVVALYVFDVSRPDDITRLARLPIVTDQHLRAVRFDGDRGYAEASFGESPLFLLDLADPSNPQIAGSLDVPGFGTHLVPLGDRLLSVGFDNTAGVRPLLVLYDVVDPAQPVELSRIAVGETFTIDTGSTATVDDEALRVIEDAGLVLLPFSTFDRDVGLFTDSVLFIDLASTSLRERGTIEHVGFVRRADLVDTRIWILSDRAFQTVNIENRDAPRSLAVLELISEQALLDGGLSGCASAVRDRGTRVYGGYGEGLCGVLGLVPMLGMFGGWLALHRVPIGPRRVPFRGARAGRA